MHRRLAQALQSAHALEADSQQQHERVEPSPQPRSEAL
jgi:hypothetical protein